MVADGWRLLDARTAEEFAAGAIPGALNVPVDDLRGQIESLRGDQWIVYCAVGKRAHVAAQLLRSQGIEARNLDGGWQTWRNTPVYRPDLTRPGSPGSSNDRETAGASAR